MNRRELLIGIGRVTALSALSAVAGLLLVRTGLECSGPSACRRCSGLADCQQGWAEDERERRQHGQR